MNINVIYLKKKVSLTFLNKELFKYSCDQQNYRNGHSNS